MPIVRILYIDHYAGSNQHGMEFRPFYLAREWVRAGHHVRIVAASYSHVRTKQPLVTGRVLDERIDGIDYRWYSTPTYQGNGRGRVLNMLSFLVALARDRWTLVDELKPDLVIASSTYPMDVWPASWIARRASARLVFEVHDLWPLTPIQLGGMSKWHPFIVIVQLAEDYGYRHADKVVSLLPKALDYMRSRGMEASKFVHVPNGIDEQDWARVAPLPAEVQSRLHEIRAGGLPIVGYVGTHGLANALDLLLDAAHSLKGRAHIVMVGGGPERERLQSRVSQEGLTHVAMLPPLAKQAVPAFLEAVDLAFMGMLPEPLYQYGISPNKLMDYMMAGKPIVLAVAAGNDPVAEAGCGLTVPPGNPRALAEAIGRLIDLPAERRSAMGRAGKEFVLKNRTYRVLAESFLQHVAE